MGILSAHCRNSPREPLPPPTTQTPTQTATPTPTPTQADPSSAPYETTIEDATARVEQAWHAWPWGPDAGAERAATASEAHWVSLNITPSVKILAVKMGARWTVGAIERDRVTLSMMGAERLFQIRERARQPMSASEFARTIGLMAYFPGRTYDGQSWVETIASEVPSTVPRTAPTLVNRPAGGRDLTFTYWVPDGNPSPGTHQAHIRITDSQHFIEVQPTAEQE